MGCLSDVAVATWYTATFMSALQFTAAILFTTMICGTASPSLPIPLLHTRARPMLRHHLRDWTAFAAILLLDMSYLTQLSIYLAPANPTRAIGCGEMSQKKRWKEEDDSGFLVLSHESGYPPPASFVLVVKSKR